MWYDALYNTKNIRGQIMKKLVSILLSAVLLINTFVILPIGNMTAEAADYAATLRNKGFPESYIKPLVALHNKYPNWIFEPFNTGLNWSTAVNGERTKHSQQLIQKYSGNSSSMYCDCASCYKNGNYVIQEASNWVSASKSAVEYYMDPRNFLNEKEIFQFESTMYNGTQTQAGVESILNGTWMHNSVISYKNTSGQTVSFKSTKYSDAIMAASNDSGLSAYYLASKIRQEVGGKEPTAGGASGTNKTYPGIYNYYNIGAYTGAVDGLKWASTSNATAGGTGYYTNCACRVRKSPTTNSAIVIELPYNTLTNYDSTTAKQSDGYTWYKVHGSYQGKKYEGYIRSDLVDKKTTTAKKDTYDRPWISPYKTIYNGALYIARNFKYQNTGYLQKFNVNKASGELYSHEYMANVQAAAAEAVTTYNAYKNANILGITKTFSIPVFNNMPLDGDDLNVDTVKNLQVTGYSNTAVSLGWNAVSGASGYQIQVFRSGGWTNYGTTTSTKTTVTGLITCGAYLFRVRAYKTYGSSTYYGGLSNEVYQVTRANKISGFKVSKTTDSSITLVWNSEPRVTGYRIYKYNDSTKTFNYYKTIPSGTTTFTDTGLKSNTEYKYEIIGYRNYRNQMHFGYGGVGTTARTESIDRWIKSGSRWWYRHADGSYTKNGWEKINNKWYHFDSEGWMQTGWLKVSGKWYYLNPDGDMATGWKKVNNKWYYLNSSGAMLTGWLDNNNQRYYLSSSGAMVTGWQQIDGYWYYFNDSGAMLRNQKVGNYYVDANGRRV